MRQKTKNTGQKHRPGYEPEKEALCRAFLLHFTAFLEKKTERQVEVMPLV
jgi:hypothetical protein